MRLQHVSILLALADAGSIRAAAQKVGRSQSALTKQLKQMEEETGLSLFQRSSRGIVLTIAGRSLLSRARSIDAELLRFNQEIDALRGQQTGAVRVSVAPLAAVKILPKAIARFLKDFPDMQIAVSSDLFSDGLKGLREGTHDIIIGPYAQAYDYSDLECEPLLTTEVAVITSRNAPHVGATSLGELTDCYWVMMGHTSDGPLQRFEEQFTRHDVSPPRVRLASESRLGLLSLIAETNAVCTFPVRLLDEIGNSSDIVQIPIKESLEPLTISMVTRAGRSLTPAGDKLADCIRHRAGVVSREWETSPKTL